jgi:hypothetical protein
MLSSYHFRASQHWSPNNVAWLVGMVETYCRLSGINGELSSNYFFQLVMETYL